MLALLAPSLAALALAHADAPLADAPRSQHIAGGDEVLECAWVDTVAVVDGGGLCSGSLVHPRVVVFAAHCGGGNDKTIRFAESSSSGGYSRQVERCIANPEYLGVNDQAHDWAFCILAEPITEIPVTPPLFGCELEHIAAGEPVVIAGFGKNTDAGGAGTKRWAQTTIVSSFGNTVNIGGDGVSTCEGDSGSSAFVQLDDGSYRAISMTSTGIGCGQTGVHALMHPAIPWIESEAQIDITPCHDLDGTWHPTGACTGFYAGGETPHGTWPDWCEGTPRSAASDSCGAPFDAVADGDAPLVAFAAPHDGDQLEPGVEIELAIDASDDGWGVQQVWIAIDGAELPNLDEYPPYGFTGVTFPAGVYTLQAFAQDWAGNVGSSTPIMIGVGMPVPADDTGDGSSTAADGSGSSGSDDTAASTDASSGAPLGSSDDTGAAQSDGEGGCGCRTHGGAAAALWLPLLAWLRRRARQPAGGLTTRPNPAPVMSE